MLCLSLLAGKRVMCAVSDVLWRWLNVVLRRVGSGSGLKWFSGSVFGSRIGNLDPYLDPDRESGTGFTSSLGIRIRVGNSGPKPREPKLSPKRKKRRNFMNEEVYVGLETSNWNLNGLCEGLRKHIARKIFDFKNFLCQ